MLAAAGDNFPHCGPSESQALKVHDPIDLLTLVGAFVREEVEQRPDWREQASAGRKYRVDDAAARPPRRQDLNQPAGANLLPDRHGGELDDPDAADGRLPQRGHVVADQARPVGDRRFAAIRVFQAPHVFTMGWPAIQARQPSEVGRRGGRRSDQTGTGNESLRAFVEPAHDEVGRLQRRKAHADGDVEPF